MKHKTTRLELRLAESEKRAFEAKAAEAGISVSKLIRLSVEGLKPSKRKRIDVDPALIRELAQIGNNLNQLARWANRDKESVEAVAVIARLIEIDRSLGALREQVEALPDAV